MAQYKAKIIIIIIMFVKAEIIIIINMFVNLWVSTYFYIMDKDQFRIPWIIWIN